MGKKNSTSKLSASQVWQWTEDINPAEIGKNEILTAYRLKLPACNACKKNCQNNSRCVFGLGQSYWLSSNTQAVYQQDLDKITKENEAEKRKPDELVGLKNLGATCYVNTYLQLWYYNNSFKNAVYALNTDCKQFANCPSTLCDHLQFIFGLLQGSVSKCIDPSAFIDCLGLATDLQQDAQEFSKLFMGMLETKPELLPVIQGQFSGQYAYCTECLSCHTVTECPALFYELDLHIQGNKDLKSCILEFLKEEMLCDENQYHCNKCQGKRDAVRRIMLKKLPPTLSLQLLRFVYDRSSCQRQKIITSLTFPDQLDFSSFVGAPEGLGSMVTPTEMVYQLSAVLIHRGPSASSGHYIAHIRDSTSGNWYEFNDEVVVKKRSGRKLDLDAVKGDGSSCFELLQEPSTKKARLSKGFHSSKDVYMLVYSKMSSDSVPVVKVPDHIQTLVDQHNAAFETGLLQRLDTAKERRLQMLENKKHKKIFIDALELETDDCEWVSTNLLKQYLGHITGDMSLLKAGPIQSYSCIHGNLSFEKVHLMKYIPQSAANILYNSLPNAERHKLQCCKSCVENQCLLLQKKQKLTLDASLVNQILTASVASDDNVCGFYVGRQSLRKWKSVAHNQIKSQHYNKPESRGQARNESSLHVDNSESENDDVFNSDILCEHDGLTHNVNACRVVPSNVWKILKQYFPHAVEITAETKACYKCVAALQEKEETVQASKKLAQKQKADLHSLFLGKNRPNHFYLHDVKNNSSLEFEEFYVLSDTFLDNWRDFVRHPDLYEAVVEIKNTVFLCSHGKLLYDPIALSSSEANAFNEKPTCVLLWSEEWKQIKKHFVVHNTIKITKVLSSSCSVVLKKLKNIENVPEESASTTKTDTVCSSHVDENPSVFIQSTEGSSLSMKTSDSIPPMSSVCLTCSPELCRDCMMHLAEEEQRQLCKFKSADIYIHKYVDKQDVDAQPSCFARISCTTGEPSPRRSRRCGRGEKKIPNVSSKWSVKDLKLKIMMHFSVPPFDQNLWFDGKLLSDDTASLESLSFYPECTVTLVEDVPNPNNMDVIFEPVKQAEPEKGFKGTALIGHIDL